MRKEKLDEFMGVVRQKTDFERMKELLIEFRIHTELTTAGINSDSNLVLLVHDDENRICAFEFDSKFGKFQKMIILRDVL